VAALVNASAAGGISDVQARIASIRAQIAQVSPSGGQPAFELPTSTPRAPGTADTGASVANAAPAATPTTLGGSPVGPTATAPSTAPSGTASGPAADAAARLTAVLPEAGKRWAGPIAEAATKHGVDPALLAALVRHESNFDPNVRSHAGAIGLGQLMPGTAAGLGVDPTDPVQNLDGAARYLKQQLDRFGSAELALAAYNAGPNRVAQAGGIPNITETRTYVARVTSTWEQYR
jgi:soluble lytic murein transglycosylase-like protein